MSLPRLTGSRLAAIVALAAAVVLLAGCGSFGPPEPVTTQGRETHWLYYFVLIVAAIVFVLVEGLILFAVIRYRRKPTDTELPPQIHGNNTLEIIWTVIPAIVVAVLFLFSYSALQKVQATTPTDIQVRAVAAQFQWSFEYLSPDGQTVLYQQLAPELTIPAGKTVHLQLKSSDVIHAFYVPKFLFKRDVVPGVNNSFDFMVDAADAGQTFNGQCAELCGTYHGAMLFTVKALSPSDYDSWLAAQIAKAKQTPPPAPSGGADQVQLDLAAKDIQFTPVALDAPADKPFTIKFQNNDPSITHNVAIKDSTGQEVFKGEIFAGVDTRIYPIPALKAGAYVFGCSVHPNMTGTLTVK
jgi:cytochrome c oxidase subunit 2